MPVVAATNRVAEAPVRTGACAPGPVTGCPPRIAVVAPSAAARADHGGCCYGCCTDCCAAAADPEGCDGEGCCACWGEAYDTAPVEPGCQDCCGGCCAGCADAQEADDCGCCCGSGCGGCCNSCCGGGGCGNSCGGGCNDGCGRGSCC